jgi:hypothetical protein
MAQLGRARHFGLTLNLATLKPFLQMLPMFVPGLPPEVAQGVNAMPDELFLSTAFNFQGGDVHWRGDWPVQEVAKIVESMRPKKPAEGTEQEEEDFK